jgi:MFS family permease
MIYRDFKLEHASNSVEDAFAANIVSLLQAGCFFGSLISAPLSDHYGRKLALALAGLAFCVGSAIQVASSGREAVIFVGRVVGGLVCYPRITPRGQHITQMTMHESAILST